MAISLDITRKLPIGVQSFEDLRKKNCLYVDKTDYVYFLTHSGTKSFPLFSAVKTNLRTSRTTRIFRLYVASRKRNLSRISRPK
ncbi:MAG: AAA family ATPase [Bacteroidales bacterium]|nr:AAA family ATPase [Bacteroidales bacterium]